MSKALKQRGFKFVGTTICYAFMQAVGIVDDHLLTCFRYSNYIYPTIVLNTHCRAMFMLVIMKRYIHAASGNLFMGTDY
jgi:hypothetical protein